MSSSKSGKTGVYLIVIDGLPEQYTWQDLKDFVRPEAEHEFWADLQSTPNGTGHKRGCIRTQRGKEAENLYNFLIRASIEGRRLKVVLWDISQSPPKLITPMSTHPMSEMQAKWPSGVAGTESALHSVVPTQIAQQQTVRYPSQAALVQAMGGFSIEQRQRQQAVCYAQQQQQQQKHQMQAQFQAQAQAQTEAARQAQQATYYATQGQLKRHDSPQAQGSSSRTAAEYISSQTGTPINVRGGVAVTVSRGVFVSGMNYKAREEDIKRKFSSVGNIVKCTLHTDASTGKSKGVATLLFESASEAQKAINKYHHATWMDKEIKVRPDKETTTIVAPPRLDSSPLIVNGSRLQ